MNSRQKARFQARVNAEAHATAASLVFVSGPAGAALRHLADAVTCLSVAVSLLDEDAGGLGAEPPEEAPEGPRERTAKVKPPAGQISPPPGGAPLEAPSTLVEAHEEVILQLHPRRAHQSLRTPGDVREHDCPAYVAGRVLWGPEAVTCPFCGVDLK